MRVPILQCVQLGRAIATSNSLAMAKQLHGSDAR